MLLAAGKLARKGFLAPFEANELNHLSRPVIAFGFADSLNGEREGYIVEYIEMGQQGKVLEVRNKEVKVLIESMGYYLVATVDKAKLELSRAKSI